MKVTPNATTVVAQNYVVKPGETLRGIGNRTGAGSEMIAKVNGLTAPYTITPGQTLKIPAGRYHLVSEGETGIAIAQAYGAKWSEIIAINGLTEPFVLRNGQRLKLPESVTAKPLESMTPEERAAAFRIDIDEAVTGSAPAQADKSAPSTPGKPAAVAATRPPATFTGTFDWPVNGPILYKFGPSANGVRNTGIDISVPVGTPVKAAGDGVVTFASTNVSVFGGLILVDHGSGWVSAYGYVSQIDAKLGQKVKKGQRIALSGDSGLGSKAKLHFELRKNRRPVDPVPQLPKR